VAETQVGMPGVVVITLKKVGKGTNWKITGDQTTKTRINFTKGVVLNQEDLLGRR
jgi:hypothetical protein